MSRICVFDVNETLLDLRALDPHFARVFGDASVRQAWFTQMLQSAFVTTITGPYRNFGTIGAAALDMIAARRGVPMTQEEKTAILSEMRRLPPHPDVRDGLERLRQAGLRLVTLTNSTEQVVQAQISPESPRCVLAVHARPAESYQSKGRKPAPASRRCDRAW